MATTAIAMLGSLHAAGGTEVIPIGCDEIGEILGRDPFWWRATEAFLRDLEDRGLIEQTASGGYLRAARWNWTWEPPDPEAALRQARWEEA